MGERTILRTYVDGWLAGTLPVPPVTALIGIQLVYYKDGEGGAILSAGPRHHNAMGTVHGGIFGDLADVAIGAAIVSTLKADETFITLGLQVEYLRAVVESLLTARAHVIKRGTSVVFCECRIEDAEGHHVAQARSTCLIRPVKT